MTRLVTKMQQSLTTFQVSYFVFFCFGFVPYIDLKKFLLFCFWFKKKIKTLFSVLFCVCVCVCFYSCIF